MLRKKQVHKSQDNGGVTISHLLVAIFSTGFLIASLVVYSAFSVYRDETVSHMAKADVDRISHLVFEHLYSVMRKGWTRAEIDDIVHHIQTQLPDYQVVIYRGEPVIRQFGDREGQRELRVQDPIVQEALHTGTPYFGHAGENLRYLYPLKTTAECIVCHTASKIGEVNGVISVSVPMAAIAAPIVNIAVPVMYLTVTLVLFLLLATFLTVRKRVTTPIVDLSDHVAELIDDDDYAKDLSIDDRWPREVQSLGNGFNKLMDNVRDTHAQLREASLRDPLTDLFNRRHFDAAITQAVADAQAGGTSFAVMYIDLDRFNPINNQFGHGAGDTILINVARAIKTVLRESDLAARIGGDEFALLVPCATASDARDMAKRLRQAIEAVTLRIGTEVVHAACSIGIATYPDDGLYVEELLATADAAMYQDKASRHEEMTRD